MSTKPQPTHTTLFELSYGLMSDSIGRQLRRQRIKFDFEAIKTFQKELNCLHTLRFGNKILNDSDFEKLLKKLHKKLISSIKKTNL